MGGDAPKVSVARIVTWWIVNPAMLVVLYFALFMNIVWCQNLIKFMIWVNFFVWFLVLLSGEEGQKTLKKKGFPVSKTTNSIHGMIFIVSLASFGWFWYATMEFVSLIAQVSVFFGDDKT